MDMDESDLRRAVAGYSEAVSALAKICEHGKLTAEDLVQLNHNYIMICAIHKYYCMAHESLMTSSLEPEPPEVKTSDVMKCKLCGMEQEWTEENSSTQIGRCSNCGEEIYIDPSIKLPGSPMYLPPPCKAKAGRLKLGYSKDIKVVPTSVVPVDPVEPTERPAAIERATTAIMEALQDLV